MIERKVLSEAFQAVLRGRRIRAAAFLTFRFDPGFFEQEILPVFFGVPLSHAPVIRVLHLEQILRETGPVAVYYDRNALEAGAASARTDFQRVGIQHRTGYFHPKNVLLLVDDEEVTSAQQPTQSVSRGTSSLIVASTSANLTRAGWWENVEVAHIDEVEEGLACGFRDDLLSLISTVRRLSPAGTEHASLDAIHAFVRKVERDPQRTRERTLVARLFTGDAELPDFLERVGGHRLNGRCLEVISPYFDDKDSTKPLLELLRRFRPRETRIFLPRGAEGEALCSESYWESMRGAGATWGRLPHEIVRLGRDGSRFVHAKVYRFFDPTDRRETFFVGSVNLTTAGFSKGGNVECGFLVEHETRRRNNWWLEPDSRRPAAFVQKSEDDGLGPGPGIRLLLRFDWRTESARSMWDSAATSPRLRLVASGVSLGEIGPLEPRSWQDVPAELSRALRENLRSSSFVTVSVDGEADAVILVEEESATHKPSILTVLSPDEILRFWSLLTPEQKKEFLEEHAGELSDPERDLWISPSAPRPVEDGIFGTFAHIYLSFGNLERAVRAALADGRAKEAIDRLFGRKFDSLRRLIEKIRDEKKHDAIRAYVTLLCAVQVLETLRKDEPEFYSEQRREFALTSEIEEILPRVKALFSFATAEERTRFFGWFERWFIQRVTPADERPST